MSRISVTDEIELRQACIDELKKYGAGVRAKLDPHSNERLPEDDRKRTFNVLIYNAARHAAQVYPEDEENVELLNRYFRELPTLLEESQTVNNMPTIE